MKILVTGGAGFIGSHLVDSLIQEGHEVLVVDDLSAGKKEYVNHQADFVELDIKEKELAEVFNSFKPEAVYHLAAQKNVRTSLENPRLDAEINILGALNVLKAAIASGAKKFIFTSTCGIYGAAKSLPTTETADEDAMSPYILNKLTFEKYLEIVSEDKIKWTALRLANVYGPRQDPHGEAGVISIFLNNAIAGKDLMVNGDGQQTRDYIYVADVVRALLKSLDKVEGIYNVGTGQETSLLELISEIKKIADKEVKVIHRDAIEGEVIRSCLNSDKIKNDLSWQAEKNLSEGLQTTYQWFKEN